MDDTTWLELLFVFFNSPVGLALFWALLLGLFFWLASTFNPFREKWRKWEGSIITAIKLAEKEVPDDVPHAGLAKLDAALRLVLDAYAEANRGRLPPEDMVHELKQAIQIKHDELDRFDGLTPGSPGKSQDTTHGTHTTTEGGE